MSGIIWGYINKNINSVNDEYGLNMMKFMKQYKINKYNWLVDKNVFMGCGLIYITEESISEILPLYDEDNKLIITCDAIIDNRDELLELLNISNKKVSDFTDSEYILMSYKKWGENCVNYLLGDYTFVIYNQNNNKIFAARDAIGQRTLYYYNDDDFFAFSTVTDPLLYGINKHFNINERWLTDFLAIDGVGNISENIETINEDILQLQPAHILSIKNNTIEIKEYWNPINNLKKLKKKSEKEYIDEFLNLFKMAIRCRIRSKDNIGIMLSSGLDSSSIAVLAAELLKSDNKKLKSYTSVPFYKSNYDENSFYICNEGDIVKELVDYIGNIEMNLCDFSKSNSVSVINELINAYGQPYKIIENSYWLKNILDAAAKDNCKVMLTGQFGNATISYGDFMVVEKSLIKKFKFIRAINEINNISKTYNISRKKIYRKVINSFLPFEYLKKKPKLNKYEYCPVNKKLIKKWDVEKRFKILGINSPVYKIKDLNKTRKSLMDPITRSHLNALQVNISLASGVLRRDPTSDKRIVEFCMSLPSNLLVNNGIERYLIRKSMEGLLPDSIIKNYKYRGLQGADWVYRLQNNWDKTYIEIKDAIEDKIIEKYIDKEYLIKNIELIRKIDKKTDLNLIRMYLIVLILKRYLLVRYPLKGGENYEKKLVKT